MTDTLTVDTYQAASNALKQKDLRQALYDEGAVVMQAGAPDVAKRCSGCPARCGKSLTKRWKSPRLSLECWTYSSCPELWINLSVDSQMRWSSWSGAHGCWCHRFTWFGYQGGACARGLVLHVGSTASNDSGGSGLIGVTDG